MSVFCLLNCSCSACSPPFIASVMSAVQVSSATVRTTLMIDGDIIFVFYNELKLKNLIVLKISAQDTNYGAFEACPNL